MASWSIVRANERLEVAGELRIADATQIWQALQRVSEREATRLDLDLRRTHFIDGAVMALLVDIRRSLVARGVPSEIVGAPSRIAPLVHLYRGDQPALQPAAVARRRGSPAAWLGAVVMLAIDRARAVLLFAGELVGVLVADVRRINWRTIPSLIERAGADGILIIALTTFLMGLTMAYQSMPQFKLYGANIYVADLVGISVARELAPLMTAVMVVGRSGAAYAAELGAMHVSDEIDALRTMGFSPVAYLVAPRVITLAITAPLLTVIGNVTASLGGLVVATTSLEITPHAYVAELRTAVVASDVWTGLVKSIAFGAALAYIGCLEGLSAKGAAAGVGRSTTGTVVVSTIAIILIDTAATVVFRGLGV